MEIPGRSPRHSLPPVALALAAVAVWTLPAAAPVRGQTLVAAAARVAPVSAISAATPDGVRVLVTEDHLLLEGRTYGGAMKRLAEVGPLTASGELASGVTDYDLLPRLVPVSDGRRCRATAVTVDANVRILLPEWTAEGAAPAPDRRRWKRFLADLTAHENAHRDITLRAAETLRAEVHALTASSCPRLVRRLDLLLRRAQERLDQDHRALDRADRAAASRP